MSDRWPYIRYGNPDATPADKIRQVMAELNTQNLAESARMFGLGAAQDDARIAQAEARGFLAGREAAAKVADEDEALYTGEAIEAAVAKRIRDAIRALESPKGGDAT